MLHILRATTWKQTPMARILICEDDALYREMTGGVLAARGHSVDLAADGHQATNAIRADRYDVIVTDLVMPGPDGLEIIREVREKHGAVKVLAMSSGLGGVRDPLLVAASALGADSVMQKPFRGKDFADQVEALLALPRD